MKTTSTFRPRRTGARDNNPDLGGQLRQRLIGQRAAIEAMLSRQKINAVSLQPIAGFVSRGGIPPVSTITVTMNEEGGQPIFLLSPGTRGRSPRAA